MQETTTGTRTLDTGVYLVDAPCPMCGALEPILVKIATVVTVPQDDVASMRVKLHAKAIDHMCRQLKIGGGA